jgi:hypothetical protein
MFQRKIFVIAVCLLASPFLLASVDNSLCRELVSRSKTRYSDTIYNLTSRINDLQEQERTPDEEQLLTRLTEMRGLAVTMDKNEVEAEVRRCSN